MSPDRDRRCYTTPWGTIAAPPPNAKPLSEIIQYIEARGDVRYFDEIEWDRDGYWEIEYIRMDGKKVKLRIDPVTGQPR